MLPFRSIVFLAVFLTGAYITGKETADIANWWSVLASAVNIVTVLLIIAAARKRKTTYFELVNIRRGQTGVKKTVLVSLGVAAVGMGCMYLAGLICYGSIMPEVSLDVIAPIQVWLAALNIIVLPATVPFAEDGLYLGCGVNGIRNRYAAVIVPAFFYALQHCFIPTFFDGRYMLYRFLSFLPLTVLMCRYYRRKRDPVPLMIGHSVLDLATAMLIFLTSAVPGQYDKWRDMM
ncbi:MAG: hypothetical protein IKO47_01525 [Ruminococcus sp.]|nr:hypothetical protein [Ruminococcus sp.]